MAKNTSRDNVPDLSKIEKIFLEGFDYAATPYFKELEGSAKQRIHRDGLDSKGKLIGAKSKRKGRYSPGYEKQKRKRSGSNVYPINLQVDGNLSRAYTVGTSQGKPVLQFQDGSIYPISSKFDGKPSSLVALHESYYKTEIYRSSKQELKDAKEILRDTVREELILVIGKI